jgi:hypothetical protein
MYPVSVSHIASNDNFTNDLRTQVARMVMGERFKLLSRAIGYVGSADVHQRRYGQAIFKALAA